MNDYLEELVDELEERISELEEEIKLKDGEIDELESNVSDLERDIKDFNFRVEIGYITITEEGEKNLYCEQLEDRLRSLIKDVGVLKILNFLEENEIH